MLVSCVLLLMRLKQLFAFQHIEPSSSLLWTYVTLLFTVSVGLVLLASLVCCRIILSLFIGLSCCVVVCSSDSSSRAVSVLVFT